jgi:hypothetical protein
MKSTPESFISGGIEHLLWLSHRCGAHFLNYTARRAEEQRSPRRRCSLAVDLESPPRGAVRTPAGDGACVANGENS